MRNMISVFVDKNKHWRLSTFINKESPENEIEIQVLDNFNCIYKFMSLNIIIKITAIILFAVWIRYITIIMYRGSKNKSLTETLP